MIGATSRGHSRRNPRQVMSPERRATRRALSPNSRGDAEGAGPASGYPRWSGVKANDLLIVASWPCEGGVGDPALDRVQHDSTACGPGRPAPGVGFLFSVSVLR